MFELLELLESTGVRTVGELADRLRVDERTVRRNVERLRELGVPVESVRGPHGGYRMGRGYRMPPLMLTEDETVAVLAGLTAARAASGVPSQASATETALAKIRRSVPARLAKRVRALLETAVVSPPDVTDPVDPAVLLTVADAIRGRRPVTVTHLSRDVVGRHTVQPHDLVAYRGRWYLVGLDEGSGRRRTLRLDRVRTVRVLPGTFPAPPEHDPVQDLVDGFARADHRHTVRVRVGAPPADVAKHLPPSVAVLDPVDPVDPLDPATTDGQVWTRATIHAESLDWLPRTLLALDAPVVVETPDELRDVLARAAASLTRMAADLEG